MGKLILVIEDDPDQRRFLERMLTASGYRVATAPDGEAGTAAAITARPDLIILDLMMPRMNGYQTCRALKSNPATASAPVLILTAKDEPASEAWATEVGAAAYVQKPIDAASLLETVSRLVAPP